LSSAPDPARKLTGREAKTEGRARDEGEERGREGRREKRTIPALFSLHFEPCAAKAAL